jgi:AraC family transcriptional regulator, regulatory protein of adaptative response / DNA-3-methyladenine glycosylase II
LFRSHYRLTPTTMRRATPRPQARDALRLTLAYRPPMAWDALLRFLSGRSTAGVELVEGSAYIRTAAVGNHRGWFKVESIAGRNLLAVELATALTPALPEVLSRIKDLFDLSARPDLIASHLQSDMRIAAVVSRCPGLRVPGAFDGFEVAVRAILGQQVSVRAATTLAGRLASRFGERVDIPFQGLDRLSPTPDRLAESDESDLIALGIGAARARAIRAIARAVAGKEIDLQPGPNPEAVADALQELPGFGDWTAQYIAMRALRWPDALPAADLGLLKATALSSAARLRDAANAWRPWRSYAAMYLWESLHCDQPIVS